MVLFTCYYVLSTMLFTYLLLLVEALIWLSLYSFCCQLILIYTELFYFILLATLNVFISWLLIGRSKFGGSPLWNRFLVIYLFCNHVEVVYSVKILPQTSFYRDCEMPDLSHPWFYPYDVTLGPSSALEEAGWKPFHPLINRAVLIAFLFSGLTIWEFQL